MSKGREIFKRRFIKAMIADTQYMNLPMECWPHIRCSFCNRTKSQLRRLYKCNIDFREAKLHSHELLFTCCNICYDEMKQKRDKAWSKKGIKNMFIKEQKHKFSAKTIRNSR